MKFKVVITVVLFSLLVVFPAVSWYYLRGGLDYRKNSMKEMIVIGDLNTPSNSLLSKRIKSDSAHVALLYKLSKGEVVSKHFLDIANAYISREDVRCILVSQIDTIARIPKTKLEYLVLDSIEYKQYDQLLDSLKPNMKVVLLNRRGKLIRGYDVESKDERAFLIKHTSILLPGGRAPGDAELIRDKEQ